jgi:hypothetical protein
MDFLFGILVIVFVIGFVIVLPATMAAERGRSPVAWVLVSVFFSPVIAIILLLSIGDEK